MHQVEEPGQPLATTSTHQVDEQDEDDNEIEVGAPGDESIGEREGATKSEAEDLEFMRKVRAVKRVRPPHEKVGRVRLKRFAKVSRGQPQSFDIEDFQVWTAVVYDNDVCR